MSSLGQPPTAIGEDAQDEPSLTHYGKTITESEFLSARRANALRWMISMGVGIPLFMYMVYLLGLWVGIVVAGFVLPAVFAAVTHFIPASKRHGTALYRRYIDHRKMLRYRQKNS